MRTAEINIRDPYILNYKGMYYLYGTRGETCWGRAEGFDCYKSRDLQEWAGPIEIFRRPLDFWADRKFWAPECYFYRGGFYLVTTFGAEYKKSGIQILVSDSPEGPFVLWSEGVVTPQDWSCIDGTLYWEEGAPYLVFSHSFEDEPLGHMCYMPMSEDLTSSAGEPINMFAAADAPWAVPVPFAKEEFGMDGDVYFTDGPCLYRTEEKKLAMIWSSWGGRGYAVGVAYSKDGSIRGGWEHVAKPLFPAEGGHGMVFQDEKRQMIYTLHYPNERQKEHPVFCRLIEKDGALLLEEN